MMRSLNGRNVSLNIFVKIKIKHIGKLIGMIKKVYTI